VGIICHGEYSHGTHHLVPSAFSTNKITHLKKNKTKNEPTNHHILKIGRIKEQKTAATHTFLV